MPLNIFITGATGYIGGEVLFQLLQHDFFRDAQIVALVRSQAKGDKLRELTSNMVQFVVGDLSNTDLLKQQYSAADVVITAAAVNHVPSAQLLAEVAKGKTRPFYIVHTSGTGVLSDGLAPSSEKKFDGTAYSDLDDNDKITSLPHEQPHRPVDEVVLNIEESNPEHVKTVIISPPAIYGFNQGYVHRKSVQIPYLINLAIANHQTFTVYDGNYIWSHVHVRDLGRLYTLLLNKLVAKDSNVKTGKKGYYFAENGSHSWKDVSIELGKVLFARGIVTNKSVAELKPDEVTTITGDAFAPYYWGTNSYSKADLARQIGWEPNYKDETFWKDISEEVDYILSNQDLSPQ